MIYLNGTSKVSVSRSLLAVSHFSNVAQKSQNRNSRPEVFCKKGFLKISQNKRSFPVNFAKFSRTFFHRTSAVAASEKLKAEAVVRRCSVKTLFLEISQNSQESLFYSPRPVTLLK